MTAFFCFRVTLVLANQAHSRDNGGMAKRTKAKKKATVAPRSPPSCPEPEDLPDIPLEVVFAEELNEGPKKKEQPASDSSEP
ncbi:MAG: hypothetical protein A2Z03_02715 [Chloroflexi bacterium RBG_16_56_8]|nr:MAG: hypothetical protein A2Z03_02715 [Chloroflexi bacterium RBG_16_56_8]